MVETMTISICDLCTKPPLLPFRRLMPMKKHDVENLTHHCLSMPCVKTLCSKCCQNLLLVGSFLLQWQGKVQVNSSFCETELVNPGMTQDVVGGSKDDTHEESENPDRNNDKDDAAQNSDKDVKPFDATTTNNKLRPRGVHAQPVSDESNTYDVSNEEIEADEDDENDDDYEPEPKIMLPRIRGKPRLRDTSCLCPSCGKKFSSKEAVRRHQEFHHIRSFRCPKCPLTFKANYQRARHMVVHQ